MATSTLVLIHLVNELRLMQLIYTFTDCLANLQKNMFIIIIILQISLKFQNSFFSEHLWMRCFWFLTEINLGLDVIQVPVLNVC